MQTGAIQEGFREEVVHGPGLLGAGTGDWRKVSEEGVWGSGCKFLNAILDLYKFRLLLYF